MTAGRRRPWSGSPPPRGPGSPLPSKGPRPRRRAPGPRSARAAAPWSSPRPAPARPCPRSCGRSTGWPRRPRPAEPLRRCRVLYISPLKALAVDVERNLRAPLTGIRQAAQRLGLPEPDITVALRSGDTPADERRAFNKTPPDIFITTPESLFLVLTSRRPRVAARRRDGDHRRGPRGVRHQARRAPRRCRWSGSTRCSTSRRQRIGLSATVRPIEEVARFLGGAREVVVVQPPATKTIEVSVVVPVEDMTALDGEERQSMWPAVEERIVDLIAAHRSTIVFCNSRRTAERLTSRINEIATVRAGADLEDRVRSRPSTRVRVESAGRRRRGATRSVATGPSRSRAPTTARCRASSASEIEEALKAGRLPAVVATSSPGARHRHGCGRPGRAGRVAAVGRLWPAADRPRRSPGRARSRAASSCRSTAATWSSARSSPSGWSPAASSR